MDRWQKRIDGFSKDISEAADLGTTFWLREGRGSKVANANEDIELVKLRGRLERLESQRIAFINWCCDKDRALAVERQFGKLNERITGGAFTDRNRVVDGDRSFDIQVEAAEMVGTVLASFEAEVGLLTSMKRFFRAFSS